MMNDSSGKMIGLDSAGKSAGDTTYLGKDEPTVPRRLKRIYIREQAKKQERARHRRNRINAVLDKMDPEQRERLLAELDKRHQIAEQALQQDMAQLEQVLGAAAADNAAELEPHPHEIERWADESPAHVD